jgi:hypothetical protein
MAYTAITTMLFAEQQVTWSRFNAMVVCHGVLLAGMGALLTNQEFSLLVIALCSVGFLLSVVWWISVTLCHDALDYWFATAVEIEHAFEDRVRTLREAQMFRRGEIIQRPLAKRRLRRTWITRYLTTRRLSYFTVLVFASVYLCVVIYVSLLEGLI